MMLYLKTLAAIILAPGVGCVLVPYLILSGTQASLNPAFGLLQLMGILAGIAGVYLILWVCAEFVRRGKGTPTPIDPLKRLVMTGCYRYTRNPMYFGAILVILGEALYFESLWLALYAAGLGWLFQIFMVIFEEPQLKRRFGADTDQSMEEVPRWILRVERR